MANRECNGDFFKADGVQYYRCLWDSNIVGAPQNGETCPNCGRVIDGQDIGELSVRTLRVVYSPRFMDEWRLPE